MEIVYLDKDIVIAYKPVNIPSQPDPTGDSDAMRLASEELEKRGEEGSLWLVHRLDRVVSGLIAFARSKASAATLSMLASECLLGKEYLAVVEGEGADGLLEDFLYKDPRTNKAFVVKSQRKGVKEARLVAKTLATITTERGLRSLVSIRLLTGRYHQIRVQLASRGLSIVGDKRYGSREGLKMGIALSSIRLCIPNEPQIDVRRLPNIEEYPWSLFDRSMYERIVYED